ncbi:MAG: hypothetical protein C0404_11020 [Verrucomicrobia bacterium]|nr:hypothetical protein [Verrucomicrobiota bacterium]
MMKTIKQEKKVIPVKVDQLFLSNRGFVVLLKGVEDKRSLPIFIGAAEAQAIAIHLNGVEIPRPLTHDLMKSVLDCLECRLMRVEVCDLREGTFFGKLVLDRDGTLVDIDSRPSDAIALALRFSAPILVAKKVMDEAGQILDAQQANVDHKDPGRKHAPPQKPMSPTEILKRDLDKAVVEERYEDAARLRDEIKRLESVHSGN